MANDEVLPDKEFDSSEYLDRPDPQYEGDEADVKESEEQPET